MTPVHTPSSNFSLQVLTIILALTALAGSHAKSAEPTLTLAMARVDSTSMHSLLFSKAATTASVNSDRTNHLPVVILPPQIEGRFRLDGFQLRPGSSLFLEAPERQAVSPLALVRRSARENSHSRLWASAVVEAGFGQVFYDKSATIYGRNGTGWEEPGCGYLKICLRF